VTRLKKNGLSQTIIHQARMIYKWLDADLLSLSKKIYISKYENILEEKFH